MIEVVYFSTCLYSFIEDWDRREAASGHLICRAANFFDPVFESDQQSYPAEQETFSTSKGDLDLFATGKVRQTCSTKNCVKMATGGCD